MATRPMKLMKGRVTLSAMGLVVPLRITIILAKGAVKGGRRRQIGRRKRGNFMTFRKAAVLHDVLTLLERERDTIVSRVEVGF